MIYDSHNIFAKILCGDVPCSQVYEDEFCLAFHDIAPKSSIHVLVIPKGAYTTYDDFLQNASESLILGYFQGLRHTIILLGLSDTGYRLATHTGVHGGQEVFHFHTHILA